MDIDLEKKVDQITPTKPMAATNAVTFVHRALEFQKFMDLKNPKPEDKIIYAPGSFDLLNPGHVKFLKEAKELGDYLIVGVHPDYVRKRKKLIFLGS